VLRQPTYYPVRGLKIPVVCSPKARATHSNHLKTQTDDAFLGSHDDDRRLFSARPVDRQPGPDGGGRAARVRARGEREEAVRVGPREVGHGGVIETLNDTCDVKFFQPGSKIRKITINSQNTDQCHIVYHIFKNPSPD